LREDGVKMILLSSSVEGHGRSFACMSLSDGSEPPNPIKNSVEMAINDSKVKDIFEYININFYSWYELYRIFEILETYPSAKRIMESDKYKKKMNDGKLKTGNERFSQNANCHRHAPNEKLRKPTDPPMTLPEAVFFIREVLREWFNQEGH
jgi:hypothetical protein